MTATLNLSGELEAQLLTQAEASGMTVEAFLSSLVEGAVSPSRKQPPSAEERAAAFEAWSASHRGTGQLLSDYAVSREGIYEGRDI